MGLVREVQLSRVLVKPLRNRFETDAEQHGRSVDSPVEAFRADDIELQRPAIEDDVSGIDLDDGTVDAAYLVGKQVGRVEQRSQNRLRGGLRIDGKPRELADPGARIPQLLEFLSIEIIGAQSARPGRIQSDPYSADHNSLTIGDKCRQLRVCFGRRAGRLVAAMAVPPLDQRSGVIKCPGPSEAHLEHARIGSFAQAAVELLRGEFSHRKRLSVENDQAVVIHQPGGRVRVARPFAAGLGGRFLPKGIDCLSNRGFHALVLRQPLPAETGQPPVWAPSRIISPMCRRSEFMITGERSETRVLPCFEILEQGHPGNVRACIEVLSVNPQKNQYAPGIAGKFRGICVAFWGRLESDARPFSRCGVPLCRTA